MLADSFMSVRKTWMFSALVELFVLDGRDSSPKGPSEVLSSATCSSEYMSSNYNLDCVLQLNFGCSYLVAP